MASKIFISYRRDDSAALAGRLYDRLVEAFGEANLFMDVDNIPAGADFVKYLNKQVANCDIFLCAVGPNWLTANDEDGSRRLNQPGDYVRIEIAAALSRDIPVIPVLIDGARVPKGRDLPEEIAPLTRRQAVEVRNSHFRRDVNDLTQKIRAILREKRSSPGRLLVGVTVAAIALLTIGSLGVYKAGMPSLPWMGTTGPATDTSPAKQTSKEEVSAPPGSTAGAATSSSLPSNTDKPPTKETSKDEVSARPSSTAGVAASSLPPKTDTSPTKETSTTNTSPSDLVTDCDRLASQPGDFQHPTVIPGVPFAQINAAAALVACNDAVSKYPDVGRFSFQLARVLEASKNYSAARRQYEQAVSLGSTIAMTNIGTLYKNGNGVPQDYTEAKRWYEKAAAAGEPNAIHEIGAFYLQGKGVPQDYTEAKRYERAWALGSVVAMSDLGLLYMNGYGVPQDYAEAKRWFEKAAAAGDSDAMTNIGGLYQQGRGVPRDYAEAKRWYEKAAAAGSAVAMNDIGLLYINGYGVARDYPEARRWFEQAAAAGAPSAMANIGVLYQTGKGVPRDYAEAKRWYENAAAAGDRDAINNIGYLYQNGMGVPRDYAEAKRWFEKAAAAGEPTAMINIGGLYQHGMGVRQDYAEAKRWFDKAAASGSVDAKDLLAKLPRK